MPSDVLKRKMFQTPGLKADSGIMQGFDEEDSDEGELPEDEMLEEVSRRTPRSPEILMNNLRGDMRSVDARYQELADMVGEEAAMETPAEVLAMLQPQLAQQAQPAGIGALPPGQGMSPPPSMPTGAPPMPTSPMGGAPAGGGIPQPMPQGPAPQGFANGGMVQGYANGGLLAPLQAKLDALFNAKDGVTESNFDSEYYLANNPDVAANWASSPWEHYQQYGRSEGRKPFANYTSSSTAASAVDPATFNARVAQGYRDVFGREADPEGLTNWSAEFAKNYPNMDQRAVNNFLKTAPAAGSQDAQAAAYYNRPAPTVMATPRFGSETMYGGRAAITATPAPDLTSSLHEAKLVGMSPEQTLATMQQRGFDPHQVAVAGKFNPADVQAQYAAAPRLLASGGIASLHSGPSFSRGVNPGEDPTYVSGPNFYKGVAHAGRNGDTVLAHITPEQENFLTSLGGGKTINPDTQLPEHYLGAVNLMSNLGQRAMPYVQAADKFAGNLMSPMLTSPTLVQGRSTLGTFLPKTAEGMEPYYPALSQRVSMAAAPLTNAIANNPTAAKIGAAAMAIPGASYIAENFGGQKAVPGMPMRNDGTDVPLPITRDTAGNQVFNQPPPPVGKGPLGLTAGEELVPDTAAVNIAPPVVPGAGATQQTNNQFMSEALKTKPKTSGERLEAYMSENLPIFEKYMGGGQKDKNFQEAQALFLLADMGLKFASKREIGESAAMAFARSARGVPEGLSTLAAQDEASNRQIRAAALTSGLQTLAAEDKATAALQKALIEKMVKSGEVKPNDLGAGLTAYTDPQGQPKGMRVDETLSNSFLGSRFTPQLTRDEKGQVQGFDTPYARATPGGQTLNLDKGTRERLASEVGRQEQALSAIDNALKDYTGAFGPKAFMTNLKNNALVPVTPLNPNVIAEKQRVNILNAMNIAGKAIARTGDTGNIAVAEQKGADFILGDKPGTFFSDPETALQRIMTVRTSIANQRLNNASQLGWINQDVQLDVPNLGTQSDPIPQDKLSYLKNMAKTFPEGQVYINVGGKVTPVLLSTLK